jgi:hypothetical protein
MPKSIQSFIIKCKKLTADKSWTNAYQRAIASFHNVVIGRILREKAFFTQLLSGKGDKKADNFLRGKPCRAPLIK